MERRPRLYCGNDNELPGGYDGFGTRYDCLRKGIGVGIYGITGEQRERALRRRRPMINRQDLERMANRLAIPLITNRGNLRTDTNLVNAIITKLEIIYNIL